MICPNCGTQLKYVFNMMTICPKCDVVDAHKDKPNKQLESSGGSFWDTSPSDFFSLHTTSAGLINLTKAISLSYYKNGIHEDKFPQYKFWIWNYASGKPFFYFTKNEAKGILRSINDANNNSLNYYVLLSMHQDAQCCCLNHTSNKIVFSYDGLSLEITDVYDQINFVDFLKKYSS
jgi:hypothetical protein